MERGSFEWRSPGAWIDRANQRPRANAHSGCRKPTARNAAGNPPIPSVEDIFAPIHSQALSSWCWAVATARPAFRPKGASKNSNRHTGVLSLSSRWISCISRCFGIPIRMNLAGRHPGRAARTALWFPPLL